MSDSPQFSRQWSRPLRPEHYRAAARRQRQLLELIERYADATDVRGKQQLSRAINGLASHARALSERHRRKQDDRGRPHQHETTMTAKTTTERVAALRQRRADQGLAEVRGIFLPPSLHPKLKEQAAKMQTKPKARHV